MKKAPQRSDINLLKYRALAGPFEFCDCGLNTDFVKPDLLDILRKKHPICPNCVGPSAKFVKALEDTK